MSRSKVITGDLDPDFSGLIVRPTQQVLSGGQSAAPLNDINEWKQLAKGLGDLGSTAGKALSNILDEQSEEDKAHGRALAIAEGNKLRQHGINALDIAERDGLLRGLRPDAKQSFSTTYGRNIALSEAFNKAASEGINRQIRESIDNHEDLETFNNRSRAHFQNKIEEYLSNLPNDYYVRDKGFLPMAEQKMQQMMANAQNSYAAKLEERQVQTTTEALYLAFDQAYKAGGPVDELYGGSMQSWEQTFNTASKFFKTGIWDWDADRQPPFTESEMAEGLEKQSKYTIPSEGVEGFDLAPLPPKASLPLSMDRKKFFWDTYKTHLENRIAPPDHHLHLKSVESALNSLNGFNRHFMHGTGSPFGKNFPYMDIDTYRSSLYKRYATAQQNHNALLQATKERAGEHVESGLSMLFTNWSSIAEENPSAVTMQDGSPFNPTKQSHLMEVLEAIPNGTIGVNGFIYPDEPDSDNTEFTWSFDPSGTGVFGAPSQGVADMITESMQMLALDKAAKAGLARLSAASTREEKLQKQMTLRIDGIMDQRLEAAFKQALANQQGGGKSIPDKDITRIAQNIEESLDKTKVFQDERFSGLKGYEEGGLYDFNLLKITENLRDKFKSGGFEIVAPDVFLSDVLQRIDISNPRNFQQIKNEVLNTAHLSRTDKQKVLDALNNRTASWTKRQNLSTPENVQFKKSAFTYLLGGDPAIRMVLALNEEKNDDRVEVITNILGEDAYRKVVGEFNRNVIGNLYKISDAGINIDDVVAGGDWNNLFHSDDEVVELKYSAVDKDGKASLKTLKIKPLKRILKEKYHTRFDASDFFGEETGHGTQREFITKLGRGNYDRGKEKWDANGYGKPVDQGGGITQLEFDYNIAGFKSND